MKIDIIYKVLCMIYSELLRSLVKKAVDDPEQEWDDVLLEILDRLFNYSE